MRIAIIAPPYPLEEIPSPPLGVTYVAAAFEAAGAEVRIFDYIVSNYTKENIKKQLEVFQPDVVGATSVTMNFYEAQQILQDVKSCDPAIITMMGGPHVSFTAMDTLRQYPEIDLIVIGEGEDTIAELTPVLKQKSKWHDIRGIAYRHDDEIIITGKRDFIADIDRIPLPAQISTETDWLTQKKPPMAERTSTICRRNTWTSISRSKAQPTCLIRT